MITKFLPSYEGLLLLLTLKAACKNAKRRPTQEPLLLSNKGDIILSIIMK